MQKNCQHCSANYEITPEDLDFYKKVSPTFNNIIYEIPPPTLCPTCRMQQRFSWRNERKLYHRKCDLTGKQIISIYSSDKPYKVYDQHEWHGDKWDGLDYGRNFNFTRPFFEQFNELMLETPKISVFASKNENSDYTNGAQQNKDCYMIFVSDHNQECYYSYAIDSCTNCIDCLNCHNSELCLECIDCSDSYNLKYCQESHNCSDSYFLSDCKNCTNCIACYGLRSKSYHIFNQSHTKEEYQAKIKELNLGKQKTLDHLRKKSLELNKNQQIHQYYDGNNNQDITGDHLTNCKNSKNCYDSSNLEDCKNLIFSFKSKICQDGHVVVDNSELCYQTVSTINQYQTAFTFCSWYSKNSYYLDHCVHCRDCFACSSLKHKQYCIFNKQYNKADYETLVPKIIEYMKEAGEWGKSFPISISPFGYNETVAQEYFPLTKEEVLEHNWKWYEETDTNKQYVGTKTEISDDIANIPEDICNQIISCEISEKPYKIIPQELEFYKKNQIPLPRKSPDQRHLERMNLRNPRKLWDRSCAKCGIALKTSYASERPETIYCEECYLKEVY